MMRNTCEQIDHSSLEIGKEHIIDHRDELSNGIIKEEISINIINFILNLFHHAKTCFFFFLFS